MGSVIKPDTERGSPAALTKTGKGGFLSKGYLSERPAGEYVGEGESPAYVLTNATNGVVRERAGEETRITPGDGYRTITIVTDQRVLVLVGGADDGDERVTLPLVEVDDATADEGSLVVAMRSGETWRIDAGDDGVEDVATGIRQAATAWVDVDETLTAVKRTLASATANRDRGDYEAGIEDAQSAYDRLADAADQVADLPESWPVTALETRIDEVGERCVRTLADVRIGHARSLLDRAGTLQAERAYERAHDTYDRARAEFEAVVALNADRHDRSEAVQDGLARIEEAVEELQAAPLEGAIDADRQADETDDPTTAVTHWRRARQRYTETLALDADEPERRFDGEPEKLRDRIDALTEQILATARDDGAEALAGGKWFLEADRPSVALEDARVAHDIFEAAVAVAGDADHEDVDEFQEWLANAEETLDAAMDATDADSIGGTGKEDESGQGEPPDEVVDDAPVAGGEPIEDGQDTEVQESDGDDGAGKAGGDDGTGGAGGDDGVETDDAAEPSGPSLSDVDLPELDEGEATSESGEDDGREAQTDPVNGPDSHESAGESGAVVSDGAGAVGTDDLDVSLEIRLRALDPDGFDALAAKLLEHEGLDASPSADDAPHDLRATPTGAEGDPAAVWTIHRPIAGPVDADQIEDIAALAEDADERPIVVTSSPTTEDAAAVAAEEIVTVLDRRDVARVLDGPMPDLIDQVRPTPE